MGNASRAAPTRPGYAEPSRNTSHAGARPGYGDRGGYGERRGTTSQRPGYGERPGYGDHPRPGYGERPSSSAPKGYGAPSGASNAGALAPYISIYESLGPAPRMTKKYAQCISCGGFGRTDRHSACPDCGYGG
ncbi:hypothetical protein P154DRAFT_526849 [Amniculicola lignicola CBS 123094]|uniref:Uncharacterized protein n=1 Tax=Amniculicola lignicola CBS 123094 TaxID=1392246 RepID=A0A6A5W0F8_9PLEO|nr:hypothetical protein P154DRAFT_526849 [Amniculicola lignicola CBS 123094]